MPKVTYIAYDGASTTVDLRVGTSVMRGALDNGIEGIVGECGGSLACGTCHCYVDGAWTEEVGRPASHDEREMLENAAAEVWPESRLSCQILMRDALDGLVVHMPDRQF